MFRLVMKVVTFVAVIAAAVGLIIYTRATTLDSIAIGGPTNSLIDEYDPDAYTLVLTYKNGGTEEIPLNLEELQKIDPNATLTGDFEAYVGLHNISVSFNGYESKYAFSLSKASFNKVTVAVGGVELTKDENVYTAVYDGQYHSLTLSNLPEGTDVQYKVTNEIGEVIEGADPVRGFKEVGTYRVEATLTKDNYNDGPESIKTAVITINKMPVNAEIGQSKFEFTGNPVDLDSLIKFKNGNSKNVNVPEDAYSIVIRDEKGNKIDSIVELGKYTVEINNKDNTTYVVASYSKELTVTKTCYVTFSQKGVADKVVAVEYGNTDRKSVV